jgi:hypothetical protein
VIILGDVKPIQMAGEDRCVRRVLPNLEHHEFHHFLVRLQYIPPRLSHIMSETGIEGHNTFLSDLVQFPKELSDYRTFLQPGLVRFDLTATGSMLRSHLVNQNQDCVTKLDRNIKHNCCDDGGGRVGGWV